MSVVTLCERYKVPTHGEVVVGNANIHSTHSCNHLLMSSCELFVGPGIHNSITQTPEIFNLRTSIIKDKRFLVNHFVKRMWTCFICRISKVSVVCNLTKSFV